MIDTSKGDTIVDYRKGDEAVVQGIKDALKGQKLQYAYDAVSEKGSIQNIAKVLEKTGKSTFVLPPPGGWDGKFAELDQKQQSRFLIRRSWGLTDNRRHHQCWLCSRPTKGSRFRLLQVLHTRPRGGFLPRPEAGSHSRRSRWRAEGPRELEERRRKCREVCLQDRRDQDEIVVWVM